MGITVTNDGGEKTLDQLFQTIVIYKDCPASNDEANVTATFELTANTSLTFEVESLVPNRYFVVFNTDRDWTAYSEDDEIEIDIKTGVKQNTISESGDSSSSDSLFLGLVLDHRRCCRALHHHPCRCHCRRVCDEEEGE